MIQKFIDSIFPDKLAGMCKTEKGTLLQGLLVMLVGLVIVHAIMLAGQLASNPFAMSVLTLTLISNAASIIISLVVLLVLHALLFFISTRVFKGTGTLDQQFYMASLPYVMMQIISAILDIPVLFFPNLICVFGIIGLVVALYGLYLLYIVVKNVHGLSSTDAAISIFLTIVILVVVYFVVAFILVMLALGSILALAGSGATGISNALVGI